MLHRGQHIGRNICDVRRKDSRLNPVSGELRWVAVNDCADLAAQTSAQAATPCGSGRTCPSVEIEQFPFASSAIGRRIIAVTRSLQGAAEAARSAHTLTRRASVLTPQQTQAKAQELTQRVMRFGQAARSAPVSPAEMNLGMWKPYSGTHVVNEAATAALRSREAGGPRRPQARGRNPKHGADARDHAGDDRGCSAARASNGWVNRKCDIDERYRRDDSHVKGIDRKLRGWCYKAPLRVRARSSSALSGLVAAGSARRARPDRRAYVVRRRAGRRRECGLLLRGAGVADCFLSIPIGGGRSVKVPSEIVSSLEQVYPRNFAFDIIDDRAFLCLGANQHVEVCQPGLQSSCSSAVPRTGLPAFGATVGRTSGFRTSPGSRWRSSARLSRSSVSRRPSCSAARTASSPTRSTPMLSISSPSSAPPSPDVIPRATGS